MGQITYQVNQIVGNFRSWLNSLQSQYNFTPAQLRDMPYDTKKQICDGISGNLSQLENAIQQIRSQCYELNNYIDQCSRALSDLESEKWRISSGNYEQYSKSNALAEIDRQMYKIRSQKSDAQYDYQACARAIDELNGIQSVASNFRWRIMGNY